MIDELERSGSLEMPRMARPYFLAYRIVDTDRRQAVGRFGALLDRTASTSRRLTIDVRVGEPAMDNTNFMLRRSSSRANRSIVLPVDNDYHALRRQLWMHTDAAYKHALQNLAKKRAALEDTVREDIPDFSDAAPLVASDPHGDVPPLPSFERLASTARELSAIFRDYRAIHGSQARASFVRQRSHYVNTEGSRIVQSGSSVYVEVLARAQAADGSVVHDFETAFARNWSSLPGPDALAKRVHDLAANMTARLAAPTVTRYNGPVLFEGMSAAELFSQVMVPRLLGVRAPVPEESRIAGFAASLRNPFVDRLGGRVLPRGFNVVDDASVRLVDVGSSAVVDSARMAALHGGYLADDEGVPAVASTLVENGFLRTLLATRSPAHEGGATTGNRRHMGLPLPSNLLVSASNALPASELRNLFHELIQERGADYGIVVRRMANPEAKLNAADTVRAPRGEIGVESLTRVFKAYPDGTEQLVRGAELSGITATDFRHIFGASNHRTVHTVAMLPSVAYSLRGTTAQYGRTGGRPIASIAMPDLLFDELTLRDMTGTPPKPPIAAHPYFD